MGSSGPRGDDEALVASHLAARASRGAVAMLMRQGISVLVNGAGALILARLLSPPEFSLYIISTLLTSILAAIGDGGVGAALLQQHEKPSARQLNFAFTLQFVVGALAFVTLMSTAPFLAHFWTSRVAARLVFQMSGISFLISTVQVVPSIMLQRSLRFGSLAAIGALQAFAFSATAVALASIGGGASALGYGLIAEAVLGTVAACLLSPWRPRLVWSVGEIGRLRRFGLPYQMVNLVSLTKDSVNPLFVGVLVGAAGVGYIGWAEQVAALPAIALMALSRLYLPVYSRLRDQPRRLSQAVNLTILACNGLAAPVAVTLLVEIHPLVHVVFGDKWRHAIPLFDLLWCANVVTPSITPLFYLLSAVGRARLALIMSLVWMSLAWVVSLVAIPFLGIIGYGVANIVIQLSNLLVVRAAAEEIDFWILRDLWKPWLAALGAAVALWGMNRGQLLGTGPAALASAVLAALGLYCLVLLAVARPYAALLWSFLVKQGTV